MSGPVKRAGGITLDQDDQGRWIHTFRQSTLNELDTCLERGRLTMTGAMPPDESDAAAVGTAVHAGIETALRGKLDGHWVGHDDMVDVAYTEWETISQGPNFRHVKYTDKLCRRLITDCLTVFDHELLERMDPTHVELPFGPITIHEDDHRVIRIAGTIDFVDRNIGPGDWKTAGQAKKFRRGMGGEAWMLDRWGVQPTTYVAALRELGIIDYPEPWPFTFFAFGLGPKIELIETTVIRQAADIDWLRQKCLSYASLVEADLGVWPKNDNHALCSDKWCPAFGMCKGSSYVGVEWPLKP